MRIPSSGVRNEGFGMAQAFSQFVLVARAVFAIRAKGLSYDH